ncbi:MAG: V-type ATP synthase subunit I [Treponema sp.]|jgi:V/A-type H+-transporting ATPase subunit I|nr:V-type ATP synthase subunit I [Treponema sp.]
MKKISIVVMDKTRDASLAKLRDLGLLHIESRPVTSDGLSKHLDRKAKAETALGILRSYKVEKTDSKVSVSDLVTEVLGMDSEKKTLQEQFTSLGKEESRVEKWGDFNPADLKELTKQGLTLIPYELSYRAYESLDKEQRFIILSREKLKVYGVALDHEIGGETPFALPEKSLSEMRKAIKNIQTKLADIEKRFAMLTTHKKSIEDELKTLAQNIEFETAKASMDSLSVSTGAIPSDTGISWLTGFAPKDDVGILKRAAAENGWALAIADPSEEDAVPTLLKNNKLASLIYPLTDFLEVVPGYREIDISGWFLLFFCIFFGMIFGDAGYGVILGIIALVGIAKTSAKGTPVMLKMLGLLALSNIAWGVITCTWFGVDTAKLPEVLRSISLPVLSSAEAAKGEAQKAIIDQNLQIFCFSLALLQLGIAHIKGFFRNIKSLKLFAELGSLAMLIGMFNLVLFLVVSNSYRQIPLLPESLYLLGGGFFLTFVFAAYEGNLGQSILYSFKNIISVVLGITNVFSDIMSYIRLWAVGLAGASISLTVNTMAGPLLGNFLIFLGIILLVFGHGLNVILNVLSVLVHGVRLNTLEFSGHLGLTWSGFMYKPFGKAVKI